MLKNKKLPFEKRFKQCIIRSLRQLGKSNLMKHMERNFKNSIY